MSSATAGVVGFAQVRLGFVVGVVDPGAKCRFWDFCLPRSLPRRGPIQSRPVGGGHARFRFRRAVGLPVGDELSVCVFGLLGELEFALADLGEVVRGGAALLAVTGWHAGAELELAELLRRERRSGERVVLVLDH